MTLKALLLRVEGVLVDVDELQRQAMVKLLAEAGYAWPCEREDFARLADLPERTARLERLVRRHLGDLALPADINPLLAVMQRRHASLMDDMLERGAVKIRPGIRDLVLGARAEGLAVALVSTLDPRDVARMRTAAGLSSEHFDCIHIAPERCEVDTSPYRNVLVDLGLTAGDCLAIEATREGLREARAAGLSVLVTRSPYVTAEAFVESEFLVDSLLALLPAPPAQGRTHLTPQDRADLVAALHRIHAGMLDIDAASSRSSDMNVSEILKAKGYAVKTITAGETIWTLAHRLKSDAIGALVVLGPGGAIDGIISERDIARGLAEHGSTLPGKKVGELMTRAVITCSPDDSVASVSRVMNQRRIRHLPVIEGGKLVGLISIGDVLSHRLDLMQKEVNLLRDFVIAKS